MRGDRMASQHGDSSSHDQTTMDQEGRPQCSHSGGSGTNSNISLGEKDHQHEPPKVERVDTTEQGPPVSGSCPQVVMVPKAESYPESSITVPEQQQQQQQQHQQECQHDPARNTLIPKTFAVLTYAATTLHRLLHYLRNGLIAIVLVVLSQLLIWGLDLVVKLVSDDFPAAIVGMMLVFLLMYWADRIDGRFESWYLRTLGESASLVNRHMSIGFTVPFVQAIDLEFRDKTHIGIAVGCFCITGIVNTIMMYLLALGFEKLRVHSQRWWQQIKMKGKTVAVDLEMAIIPPPPSCTSSGPSHGRGHIDSRDARGTATGVCRHPAAFEVQSRHSQPLLPRDELDHHQHGKTSHQGEPELLEWGLFLQLWKRLTRMIVMMTTKSPSLPSSTRDIPGGEPRYPIARWRVTRHYSLGTRVISASQSSHVGVAMTGRGGREGSSLVIHDRLLPRREEIPELLPSSSRRTSSIKYLSDASTLSAGTATGMEASTEAESPTRPPSVIPNVEDIRRQGDTLTSATIPTTAMVRGTAKPNTSQTIDPRPRASLSCRTLQSEIRDSRPAPSSPANTTTSCSTSSSSSSSSAPSSNLNTKRLPSTPSYLPHLPFLLSIALIPLLGLPLALIKHHTTSLDTLVLFSFWFGSMSLQSVLRSRYQSRGRCPGSRRKSSILPALYTGVIVLLNAVLVSSLAMVGYILLKNILTSKSLEQNLGDFVTSSSSSGSLAASLFHHPSSSPSPSTTASSSSASPASSPRPGVGAGDIALAILNSGIVSWGLKLFECRSQLLSTSGITVVFVSSAAAVSNFFLGPMLAYGMGLSGAESLAFAARSVTLAMGGPVVEGLGGNVTINAAMVVLNGLIFQIVGDWVFGMMGLSGQRRGGETSPPSVSSGNSSSRERGGSESTKQRDGAGGNVSLSVGEDIVVAAELVGRQDEKKGKNEDEDNNSEKNGAVEPERLVAAGITVGINAAAMGTAHLYERCSDAAPFAALSMTVIGVVTVIVAAMQPASSFIVDYVS